MLYVDVHLPADIGERVHLRTAACASQDAPILLNIVLPFTGGDAVLVAPT